MAAWRGVVVKAPGVGGQKRPHGSQGLRSTEGSPETHGLRGLAREWRWSPPHLWLNDTPRAPLSRRECRLACRVSRHHFPSFPQRTTICPVLISSQTAWGLSAAIRLISRPLPLPMATRSAFTIAEEPLGL